MQTPPGNQPVGMKPRTTLDWSDLSDSLTTAMALLPPLATKSVRPSLLTARALVMLPKGRLGSGRTEMVSRTRKETVSITDTESELALATNSSAPSGDSSMSEGCRPTLSSPRGPARCEVDSA